MGHCQSTAGAAACALKRDALKRDATGMAVGDSLHGSHTAMGSEPPVVPGPRARHVRGGGPRL